MHIIYSDVLYLKAFLLLYHDFFLPDIYIYAASSLNFSLTATTWNLLSISILLTPQSKLQTFI